MAMQKMLRKVSQYLGLSVAVWLTYTVALDALKRIHVLVAWGFFLVTMFCILLNIGTVWAYLLRKFGSKVNE